MRIWVLWLGRNSLCVGNATLHWSFRKVRYVAIRLNPQIVIVHLAIYNGEEMHWTHFQLFGYIKLSSGAAARYYLVDVAYSMRKNFKHRSWGWVEGIDKVCRSKKRGFCIGIGDGWRRGTRNQSQHHSMRRLTPGMGLLRWFTAESLSFGLHRLRWSIELQSSWWLTRVVVTGI